MLKQKQLHNIFLCFHRQFHHIKHCFIILAVTISVWLKKSQLQWPCYNGPMCMNQCSSSDRRHGTDGGLMKKNLRCGVAVAICSCWVAKMQSHNKKNASPDLLRFCLWPLENVSLNHKRWCTGLHYRQAGEQNRCPNISMAPVAFCLHSPGMSSSACG